MLTRVSFVAAGRLPLHLAVRRPRVAVHPQPEQDMLEGEPVAGAVVQQLDLQRVGTAMPSHYDCVGYLVRVVELPKHGERNEDWLSAEVAASSFLHGAMSA